ncbi:MAG: nitrate/nitrite transporter [Frankiaceae bacterium]
MTVRRRPSAAWVVWSVGVLAYAVAVFHRASLGVVGIDAQHRFGASAAVLSLMSVLQLAVYAAMQVPVGVALDRLGSRRLIVIGAAVMAAGQLTLSAAHGVPLAIAARVLVGAGDAMTFISVLRLVPAWFPSRQAAVVTQLTGILGQLGQVAAAFPLLYLLHHTGWTRSFLVAGVVGVATAVVAALWVVDAPAGAPAAPPVSLRTVRHHLGGAWNEPGTRLGLWAHFVTQFSGTVFGLFWGYPFLVAGEGVRPAVAGALLTVLVVSGMVVGPVLGRLAGAWPMRRSALVFTIVGASALCWLVVLCWPGQAPLPLLTLLVVVLGSNGPGSLVGFDYARTENEPARLGGASGIVNVGGFVASLTLILGVGVVLDLLTGGGADAYDLRSFRIALTLQYALWAVGLVGFVRARRRVRRRYADRGIVIEPLPQAVLRRVRTRRGQPQG